VKKSITASLVILTISTTLAYANGNLAGCIDDTNIRLSQSSGNVINIDFPKDGSNWAATNINVKDITGNVVWKGGGGTSEAYTCYYDVKNARGDILGSFDLKKGKELVFGFTTLRVCNFYKDPVIWRAVSAGAEKYVLTNNDVTLAASSDGLNGKCGEIALRMPSSGGDVRKVILSYTRPKYNNKGNIDINEIIHDTSSDTISNANISKVISINNVEQSPANNRDILSVYVNSNSKLPRDSTSSQNIYILRTGAQLTKLRSLPDSSVDFTICIGDKTGNKCNSTAFAQ
jgi:hypothetical protein